MGGAAARRLSPDQFEKYLLEELRGCYQRENMLVENRALRISEAIDHMTDAQAQELDSTLWQELLGHKHQLVRKAALRASRHRQGATDEST